ncbi:MAG: GWxTD domain-containing protein [Candidatus Marinimicrobia bacterium]|nr:GWxTD domain-containing protein [Candidatus Neomarinimicrobiota bacterium]
MKRRRHIIFALLLIFVGSLCNAQAFQKKWKIGPEYKIEYLIRPGAGAGEGELEVRLSIPYDEILFVKNNANFNGRFDVSIMIFEGKEKRISESWVEKATLNEFRITNSRKKAFDIQRVYPLPPGKYRLEVLVTDLKTQNRRKQVKEIDMSRLNEGSWMMGDLYFVDDGIISKDSNAVPEAIYIAFAASGINGTYPFTYTLLSNGKPLKQGTFELNLVARKHEYSFPVRTADLSYNQYYLVLKTRVDGHDYERSIPLRIAWSGTNALIPNLDEAIEQMLYLSHMGFFPARVYKKALNGNTEEQKAFFTETWDKMDPTPGTESNELMNEYYFRVQTANRRFSGHKEGWRSDQGMIYIIYGEPDAVEEHYMEIDSKPYIIWYYYTVNRRFMFVDYTGFGDFQLTEPLSEY